ncbi:ahpC/TSA family protein, partial [Mycobacterium xenopi 4042]
STPGCTKEAGDFRDNLHDLSEAGLDVVGISPDPPPSWPSSVIRGLTFPLLSVRIAKC